MREWEVFEPKLFLVLLLHLPGVVTLCLDCFDCLKIFIDLLFLDLSLGVLHISELLDVLVCFSLLLGKFLDSVLDSCLLPLLGHSQMLQHLLFGFFVQIFVEEHGLFANSILFS